MEPKVAIIKRIGVYFETLILRPIDHLQGTGLRHIRFGSLPKLPFSTARITHMEQVLVRSVIKGEPCNRSIEGDSFLEPEKEKRAEAIEGGGYEDFYRYTSGRWM